MPPIIYRGWPFAVALPDRVVPHPAIEALAERDGSHPLVRLTWALTLHAFELRTGLIEGPVDESRAERYARELLMPADDFAPLVGLTDAELAAAFGVPIEQVSSRRRDLGLRSARRY
jgi:hypothetical protein